MIRLAVSLLGSGFSFDPAWRLVCVIRCVLFQQSPVRRRLELQDPAAFCVDGQINHGRGLHVAGPANELGKQRLFDPSMNSNLGRGLELHLLERVARGAGWVEQALDAGYGPVHHARKLSAVVGCAICL